MKCLSDAMLVEEYRLPSIHDLGGLIGLSIQKSLHRLSLLIYLQRINRPFLVYRHHPSSLAAPSCRFDVLGVDRKGNLQLEVARLYEIRVLALEVERVRRLQPLGPPRRHSRGGFGLLQGL